jgi:regulator of nucleoside diphosphate kinase
MPKGDWRLKSERPDGELPPVYLSLHDYNQLRALLAAEGIHIEPEVRRVLLREINRATVCPSPAIPEDAATMHSRVVFRRHSGLPLETRILCYDDEDPVRAHTLSVLSPLGAAVLGLRAGSAIDYTAPDGKRMRATVEVVPYQPEAHGRSVRQLEQLWPSRRAVVRPKDDDPGPAAA